MALRDSGWIQLHAETAQEAADLHVLAFRIAEELSCPVMVCIDGFVLTHSYEAVDVPSQEEVDEFLPPFEPRQVLDPAEPITIGAMVGPEAFMEVRYLQHQNLIRALQIIPEVEPQLPQSVRARMRRPVAEVPHRRRGHGGYCFGLRERNHQRRD